MEDAAGRPRKADSFGSCAVVEVRRRREREDGSGGRTPGRLPVAKAKGPHLFSSRTQKLSPSAPMVLGWKRPGRVGRRRFPTKTPARGCLRAKTKSQPARPGFCYFGEISE